MRFTKSHRKLADVDDEEGKAQFFLLLLFQRYVFYDNEQLIFFVRWEAELHHDHKLYHNICLLPHP